MDVNLELFDPMYDITFITFLQDWLSTIVGGIAVWWIIAKLKEIDKGVRRDNVAKHTEFRLEAIASALSTAPNPIGEHFKGKI